MLSLNEFLANVKRDYASDISVEDLLRYFNRIQRLIFTADTGKMHFLNSADPEFPYPILPTTAGQLEYDITQQGVLKDSQGNDVILLYAGRPVEVSDITSVFISNESVATYKGSYGYGRYEPNKNIFRLSLDAYKEAPVTIIQRDGFTAPLIVFQEDPGETGNVYYVDFTISPTTVTSLNSPASVDLERWEYELTTGIVGEVEKVYDGESAKADLFYKKFRKKIQDSMRNGRDLSVPFYVQRRDFG